MSVNVEDVRKCPFCYEYYPYRDFEYHIKRRHTSLLKGVSDLADYQFPSASMSLELSLHHHACVALVDLQNKMHELAFYCGSGPNWGGQKTPRYELFKQAQFELESIKFTLAHLESTLNDLDNKGKLPK